MMRLSASLHVRAVGTHPLMKGVPRVPKTLNTVLFNYYAKRIFLQNVILVQQALWMSECALVASPKVC